MNAVFRTRNFWLPYFTLEPGELNEQDFVAQQNALRTDFPVRREQGQFDYHDKKLPYTHDFADFEFFCTEHYLLRVEYQIPVIRTHAPICADRGT